MAKKGLRAPRVNIQVTDELIESAIPRDSSHCMIADALGVAYPKAQYVSVDVQTIRFTDREKGLRFTYLTPRTCQLALLEFDLGKHPEPFSFELRGGQVTMAGHKHRPTPESSSGDRKKADLSDALKKAHLSKKSVLSRDGVVPVRIGGKTPPRIPFARRREFGLRAMVR